MKFKLTIILVFIAAASLSFCKFSAPAKVDIEITPDRFDRVSAGQTVSVEMLLKPGMGVHLNTEPEPQIVLEEGPAVVKNVSVEGRRKADSELGITVFEGQVKITAEVKFGEGSGDSEIRGKLTYFPCDDKTGSCFMLSKDFSIPVNITGTGAVSDVARNDDEDASGWIEKRLNRAFSGSPVMLFLLVFLGGILSSLTPCVYPMIPITVGYFGGSQEQSRVRVFIRAVVYLLGIAIVYASFGVAAAATGKAFGSISQKPSVLLVIGAFFYLMGLSMMGLFEIRLPGLSGGATRRQGLMGAFLLGAMSGLVASPCLTPVLAALLAYVAGTGNLVYGFFILFTFALGLGLLLVVIAVFSSFAAKLPKAGGWMNGIKVFLGIVLAGAGIYFLEKTLTIAGLPGTAAYAVGWGVVAVFAGFLMRPFSLLREDEHDDSALLQKALAVILIVVGCSLSVFGVHMLFPAEGPAPANYSSEQKPGAEWLEDYDKAAALSLELGKPLVIDFWAEWCVYCKKLEKTTFMDSRVLDRADDFIFLKVNYDRHPELARKFSVSGLPTVVFLRPDGTESSRATSWFNADKMLEYMNSALK